MNERPNTHVPPPRISFISYLQVIGIILVVLGHSFHQYPDGESGNTLWLFKLIYSVHMPVFIFVSGYLMYYTTFMAARRTRSLSKYTADKVKRLLIPYIVLSIVTFIPRAMLSSMADDTIHLSFGSFIRSLVYSDNLVVPYFWFLQMSFILLVATYGILLICGQNAKLRTVAIWALVIFFATLPYLGIRWGTLFALNEVVRLGIYFILGIVYCRYEPWIDHNLCTDSIVVMLISAVVWIVMFFAFDDITIARVASIFGIYALIYLTKILVANEYRFLDHLQEATYLIFLLSWYVNVLAQQVLSHYIALPWWVHTALSLIGGIYIPWLGYRYLDKHSDSRWVRIVAFLLGQKMTLKHNT